MEMSCHRPAACWPRVMSMLHVWALIQTKWTVFRPRDPVPLVLALIRNGVATPGALSSRLMPGLLARVSRLTRLRVLSTLNDRVPEAQGLPGHGVVEVFPPSCVPPAVPLAMALNDSTSWERSPVWSDAPVGVLGGVPQPFPVA